jgi:hypothetical protein
MLLRLKDLPCGGRGAEDTDGNEAKYGFGRLINVVPDSKRS